MKRLTPAEREQRILSAIELKDYELLGQDGEDKAKNTKYKLRCAKDGYVWSATYNNIVNVDRGCARCYGNEPYTPEIMIETLNQKIGSKYEFSFDEFKGAGTRLDLKCKLDGYVWSAAFGNIVNIDSGCPRCSSKERYTRETMTDKLDQKIGSKYEFSFDEFKGNSTRINLKCKTDGYEWTASFSNIVNIGQGCPVCAECGFQPDKPGDFYINTGLYNGKPFIKYGVTQQKGDARLKRQYKNSVGVTDYNQIHRETFLSGSDALLAEKFFDGLKGERLPKEVFPDGYTETITNIPVDEIMKMINDGKHIQ